MSGYFHIIPAKLICSAQCHTDTQRLPPSLRSLQSNCNSTAYVQRHKGIHRGYKGGQWQTHTSNMSRSSLPVICSSIELCCLLTTKIHDKAKAPGELTSNQSRLSNQEAWYWKQDRETSRNKTYRPEGQDTVKGFFVLFWELGGLGFFFL